MIKIPSEGAEAPPRNPQISLSLSIEKSGLANSCFVTYLTVWPFDASIRCCITPSTVSTTHIPVSQFHDGFLHKDHKRKNPWRKVTTKKIGTGLPCVYFVALYKNKPFRLPEFYCTARIWICHSSTRFCSSISKETHAPKKSCSQLLPVWKFLVPNFKRHIRNFFGEQSKRTGN